MLEKLTRLSGIAPILTLAALVVSVVYNMGALAIFDASLVSLLGPSDYIKATIVAMPVIVAYMYMAYYQSIGLTEEPTSGPKLKNALTFRFGYDVLWLSLMSLAAVYFIPAVYFIAAFFLLTTFIFAALVRNCVIRVKIFHVGIPIIGGVCLFLYGAVQTFKIVSLPPQYMVRTSHENLECKVPHMGSYGLICVRGDVQDFVVLEKATIISIQHIPKNKPPMDMRTLWQLMGAG
ncbi:hypothetical protein IZ6_18830 [Terrihabitans soli]|uniref:Uncharacterized protein n=1 Tax=Terrihabitans soli TaxID=708113 RepID=A0A6S6QX71_9HYPH|nr:hypothetical protein [Terrihabitans soli]BCJ91148.1 hypothetical protein IZ6_18830 [Terrihabitans soli]